MAIISTETKASAASPGNNTGLSFNLSHQREAYQGLAEDGNALLIKAEQFTVWHKISLCTDFLVVPQSSAFIHISQLKMHNAFIPSTFSFQKYDVMFLHPRLLLFPIVWLPCVYHLHNNSTPNSNRSTVHSLLVDLR